MNKKSNVVVGAIFVLLGVLFLLSNLGLLEEFFGVNNIWGLIGLYWPAIFLILPGLAFHYGFFSGSRRDPGLLVPGGILLVLGVSLQINMLYGGWGILWPAYILAVAVGLFELYIFGPRDRGLLIPVGILGGLSVIFFTRFTLTGIFDFDFNRYIIPIILIVLGVFVIFGGRSNKKGY